MIPKRAVDSGPGALFDERLTAQQFISQTQRLLNLDAPLLAGAKCSEGYRQRAKVVVAVPN